MDPLFIPVISSIVAALAAICAALISAHYNRRTALETSTAAKLKEEIERLKTEAATLKRDLGRAYRQVAAYYELESIAAEELSAHTGKAAKTAKSEMRDEVKARGFDRPEWTHNEIEKRINELVG